MSTDHGLALQLTLHEIRCGPTTPRQGMEFREKGGSQIKLTVVIDAMSILAALEPERIKAPTEQSLLSHLLWLREIVDRRIMDTLNWRDTRDMTVDGHTKGCIDRSALHEVASGILKSTYEGKILSPRVIMKKSQISYTILNCFTLLKR